MRIAYLTPLPPEPTGIADYSVALVPELSRHTDIEVFTSEQARRTRDSRTTLGGVTVSPYDALRERRGEFDVVVYQMGNSPFHRTIRELALDIPGVLVLHEFVMHHLVRGATLDRGDPAGYIDEMRYCYGASGQRMAQLAVEPEFPIDLFSFPLFERLTDRSLAVIAHNEFTRARVSTSRPLADVFVVPSPISFAPQAEATSARSARAELGLSEGAYLVGTFGLVTPAKRLEPLLTALSSLQDELDAHLVVAGDVSPHYDLDRLLTSALRERVHITGRLDEERFRGLMASVDVGVNLRYPSAGETSYTLLWLMQHGRCVLVTAQGPCAELPDAVAVKVPVGADETPFLIEALSTLAREPETRRAIGEAARRWVSRHHTPERAAAGYLEALDHVAQVPAPPRAVPPLASFARDDIEARVMADVAAGLADLGVAENDDDVLLDVARRLRQLGFGAPGPAARS